MRQVAPWIALATALVLGPVGFLLCLLIVFGSGHGNQTSLGPSLIFCGSVVSLPPVVLGLYTVRRCDAHKWAGYVAIVTGALLMAFYTLWFVLLALRHAR